MALSASAASAGRGSRAEKVRRIFERFDTNGDGGLDRNEMAALVVAVNPRVKFSEDQISAILDEVFRTYAEFILPDGRGLSLPGLLRTYDDGAGDVDRDFLALSLPAVDSDASSPEIAAGDAAAHSSPPSAAAAASLLDDHAKPLGDGGALRWVSSRAAATAPAWATSPNHGGVRLPACRGAVRGALLPVKPVFSAGAFGLRKRVRPWQRCGRRAQPSGSRDLATESARVA